MTSSPPQPFELDELANLVAALFALVREDDQEEDDDLHETFATSARLLALQAASLTEKLTGTPVATPSVAELVDRAAAIQAPDVMAAYRLVRGARARLQSEEHDAADELSLDFLLGALYLLTDDWDLPCSSGDAPPVEVVVGGVRSRTH
jgi:hypothetical protein